MNTRLLSAEGRLLRVEARLLALESAPVPTAPVAVETPAASATPTAEGAASTPVATDQPAPAAPTSAPAATASPVATATPEPGSRAALQAAYDAALATRDAACNAFTVAVDAAERVYNQAQRDAQAALDARLIAVAEQFENQYGDHAAWSRRSAA